MDGMLELRQSRVNLPQEFDELTATEQLMNKKPAKNSKEEAQDGTIQDPKSDGWEMHRNLHITSQGWQI